MLVTSDNKDLQMLLSGNSKAVRSFGQQRYKLLQRRIKMLQQAETLEDVRNVSGHFHELTENRKGQWACDLDQPYRLIFVPHENPIPQNENGQYVWIEIKGVELTEIVNYHEKRQKR